MNNLSFASFIGRLKILSVHKDRHIKGHSIALLKRLQEITEDIDEDTCTECKDKRKLEGWTVCEECLSKDLPL